MSGLDKMKSRILEEADHSAKEIIGKAQTEAEAIIKAAEEEARTKRLRSRRRRSAMRLITQSV